MDALEERIKEDAKDRAIGWLGDDDGVVNGFVWVAYPGSQSGLRALVFPRPIVASAFFDRVESSIFERLAHRPVRGVRSAPSIRTHNYGKRPHAAYLSLDVLAGDVDRAEKASRLDVTGVSRFFEGAPQASDLVSDAFGEDEIDSYVPSAPSYRSLVSRVERFVRIDRFGSKEPGDLDVLAELGEASRLPGVSVERVTPRGYVCSIRSTEYRLRTVELVRDGLVDDHWYVDAHDVLRALRSYVSP